MSLDIVNPSEWKQPVGYSNGVLAGAGRILFLGGQVAFDAEARVRCVGDLTGQFRCVLENLRTVCRSAGGELTDIAKLVIFVKDRDDYRRRGRELGAIYREFFGRHFPAMTLVEISRFYEADVLIEIEGIAVIPERERSDDRAR